ncbi:MAG: CBS domain-containing protein [Planctomycetota bacterium]|nr:CBS domain-containing protein [Planctomycetota bacterium]
MRRAAEQLRSLERFREVLTVSTILEEIAHVGMKDTAIKALSMMQQRRFDVLGLYEKDRVVAYLDKNDLESAGDLSEAVCASFRSDWKDADLVTESCPLADCMARLRERQRLFVHTSGIVHGIVTQADLHKQPVRMLLFSVISLLEMALLSVVRETYHNEKEWTPLLSKPRLRKTRELLRTREEAGHEIDLLDCLQLGDKGTIIKKTDDLRSSLGFGSKTKCGRFFTDMDQVRNALAHGGDFEDIPDMTWEKVLRTFEKARDVLERAITYLDGSEHTPHAIRESRG